MKKCKLCNADLTKLNYYYDDDWGYKGSKVWDNHNNEKELYHCPECGLVYALKNDKDK